MPPASTVLDPLRDGPTSSTALLKTLQLPHSAVSRELQAAQREGLVVKMGATRGTRYALPRTIAGAGTTWPVFRVDPTGKVHDFGRLDALMPRHFHFESAHKPLKGVSEGLPWFLRDLHPSGFLGNRAGVDAARWNEDGRLAWAVRHGWDCAGDLIIGAEALEACRHALPLRQPVKTSDRAACYPRLAQEILDDGQPLSQLGGEQPKFTVLVSHAGHLVHTLVKFSPSLDTPAGQRWSDLLIAEHLAHGFLNARGVSAAHSRVYRLAGRVFLEMDRFDRVGAEGRRGVVPLHAAALAQGETCESWSKTAMRLNASGALPRTDARQIRLVETFAGLIANTDRSCDNLMLFDKHDGTFALAPVFDMLPMLFAPQEGGFSDRRFEPPAPSADAQDIQAHAHRLAEGYWDCLVGEPQLSAGFRELCAQALAALRAAAVPATQS